MSVMRITVNGDEVQLNTRCTVRELLERFDLGAAPCAVEVNAEVVPKTRHPEHVLDDGDRVEIVTLVGGG